MVSKAQERICAEEAVKLLGADWEIIDIAEPPDFAIRTNGEIIGLEIRQIFMDRETASGSRLKRVEAHQQRLIQRLARRYYELGGLPLHLKVLGRLDTGQVENVAQMLVSSRPTYIGPASLSDDTIVEFEKIKLFLKALPDEFGAYMRWIGVDDRVGWVREVTCDDLQQAIGRKASRLDAYRSKYPKTILLLVADRRFRSGKLAGNTSGAPVSNPGFHAIYFMSRLESIEQVG